MTTEKRKKIRLTNPLDGVKEEMKKVSWTSKKELYIATKVVIVATFIFGLGIYLVDLALKNSLDGLSFLTKWIFS